MTVCGFTTWANGDWINPRSPVHMKIWEVATPSKVASDEEQLNEKVPNKVLNVMARIR